MSDRALFYTRREVPDWGRASRRSRLRYGRPERGEAECGCRWLYGGSPSTLCGRHTLERWAWEVVKATRPPRREAVP